MLPIPSSVIATSFALLAFVAAAIVGVLADNPTLTVIGRATLVMVVCWPVGLIVGGLAQRTVDAHVKEYKDAHPIPEDTEVDAETAPEALDKDTENADEPIASASPTAPP